MKWRGTGLSRTAAVLVVLLIVVAAVAGYSVLTANQNSYSYSVSSGQGSISFTSSTIKIGYITELSGPDVSNGYAAKIGAELAVNQTNAAGGIDGKTVDLIVTDDQSNPQKAIDDAESLYQQGALAISGPTDETVAAAVGAYAEAQGFPFVVSAVPSAALTPPGSRWTVSLQPDAVQWGAAMAKYVSEAVPGAKIALITQNAEQQNEMAAGVRWFADTYKNESIVFDQEYANSQFPWATAAAAAKFSGANAVVVSWISAVGFVESNVVTALLSAGFTPNQIFVADATDQVTDLGPSGTGIRGATIFDSAMANGHPNATAFANELAPYVDGELNSPEYCGVCPTDIGPLYYYTYLGTEMMLNTIRSVLSGGQQLTRADFVSSMKQASVQDAFGNTLSLTSSGASVGHYYIVEAGQLGATATVYPLQIVESIEFAPGVVPAFSLAKGA